MKLVDPVPPADLEYNLLESIKNELSLSSEMIRSLEKTHEYLSGDGKFRHSLFWCSKLNAHYILITEIESDRFVGYTCQDIEGQYLPCKISSPFLEDAYEADSELIDELLELIDSKPENSNAFAILESGGCYIQTKREKDGFLLEYQAVSNALHFKILEKLELTDVRNAFQSFNEGSDQWSYCLHWERVAI
ncbi:hypothetical protein [Microbulbifer aggregans]|uniref:hypothetical protein n=1 Tax=Microbulbifer aggregans TaxID=1769779 RepID=UPI001CFF4D41|nr:hypothetical protein [Microbulbifer aggregans]